METDANCMAVTYVHMCVSTCVIAGDFMKPDQVIYDDIVKFQELKRFMEEQLEDYNMEPGIIAMDLVLFRDAIDHGKG